MQIGMMNHPARDPLAEIEWAAEYGFDFVDFTFEPPAADPDDLDTGVIRAALERYGLGVVAHTPWFVPLGSPFARIREAALNEFRRCLQAARHIGSTVMNTHYRRLPYSFTRENAIVWHAETLAPLCDEAAELGVAIVLEHVPEGGSEQLENFVEIMERVPLLGFHLDSGHAKMETDHDRFDEYLDRLGHKLRHVHLSDNDGTADQHLPLGCVTRRETDWPGHIRKLKATGYDDTITLEVFSPQKEYLLLNRDLLRRWWDEA